MSTLSTIPPEYPMGSDESKPLGVDFAAYMREDETLSAPSARLEDLNPNGEANGVVGSSSIADTVVTQRVSGLKSGHNYRLIVTATMGDRTESTETLLICEF